MKAVLTLTKFLNLFVIRRVLYHGMLRIPAIRWVFIFGSAAFVLGFCALGVIILDEIITDPVMLIPLLRVAGTAVPLWVIAIYAAVKIMFMKSGQLVELTFGFPLTNRARALAFMLFEALFVIVGIFLILAALVSGVTSIGGLGVLSEVTTSLVMPTVVCYLLVSIFYLAIERIILFLRIARLRSFLIPIVLAISLGGVYFGITNQSEKVLFSSVGLEDYFAIQLIYSEIADAWGIVISFLFWVTTVGLLVALVCFLTSREFVPTKRFANILYSDSKSEFSSYLAAYFRSIETITLYGIVLLASFLLFIITADVPPFLLLALAIQGVYFYSATEPIRALSIARNNVFQRYALLLSPQLLGILFASIPIGAVAIIVGISWVEVLSIILFSISGVIIMTLSGIAFPPERGNPFSVIIGIFALGLVAIIIILGINIFNLPLWINFIILMFFTALAAFLSVAGMQKIEREKRYEMAA